MGPLRATGWHPDGRHLPPRRDLRHGGHVRRGACSRCPPKSHTFSTTRIPPRDPNTALSRRPAILRPVPPHLTPRVSLERSTLFQATRVHPETTYGLDAVPSLSAERIRDDPHGVMRDVFGSRGDPIELLWQKPRDPTALLLLAHGCHHAATDFFPKSETCPTCAGLPEESRVVAKALARGYVVAAVSSRGACWDVNVDAPRVIRAVSRVSRLVPELAGKPTFAFGASSGGAFVGALPFFGAVDGVISQISSVRLPSRLRDAASLREELRAQGGRGDYPPVVFSHMSRDVLTGELVDRSREYLESVGVPVRVTELDPQPVDDGFFHRRIVRAVVPDARGEGAGLEPVVRLAESKAMAAKLRDAGMLDTEGYLRDDPRTSDWRRALGAHAKAMGDSTRPDASGLSEVLNVAYASHELSADGFDGDMKWLEDHRRKARTAATAARAARGDEAGDERTRANNTLVST